MSDWGNTKELDWNAILDTITETDEEKLRELWDLININDSEGLTLHQLESGMGVVTRTEDFFDCLPAIDVSLKYTKMITVEPNSLDEGSTNDPQSMPLNFSEFGVFLKLLHQYYVYCQAFGNDELDVKMMIKKVDFKSRNNKPIMTAYLGADFDQRQAFKEMDQNKAGYVTWDVLIEKLLSTWVKRELSFRKSNDEKEEEEILDV